MNKNAKRRAICANKIELSRMNDCTLPSTNDYRAITSWQLVRHVLASARRIENGPTGSGQG